MAKYIKKEIVDLNGKGATQAYYRMKTWRKLETEEFVKRCHDLNGAFSESILKGALAALTQQLAYELAKGYSVKLDGLGVFNAKIGLRKDKEQDDFSEGGTRRNAASLQVTGVSLKVDKELVRAINKDCDLERGGEERLVRSKYTLEERIERARNFIRRNGYMRNYEYAQLNGLSNSTASRELIRITNDPRSGIRSEGSKSSKIYLLSQQV
jgi:predicted histone-like DNA-binding protein